jgi:hypothetical protein
MNAIIEFFKDNYGVIIFFSVLFLVYLCVYHINNKNKYNPDNFYLNDKCIVIEKGGYSEKVGKYNNQGKYFLIQRISDTTQFTELNGYNWKALADKNGSQLYYSKDIGDTLFFEYIDRSRFFRIK